MKMLSATSIAALALGLTLSGTAAYAADYPARHNQDATTQQQNDENDKGDRKDRRAKPPVKAAPAAIQLAPRGDRNRQRDGKVRRGQNEHEADRLIPVDRRNWNGDNRRDRQDWNRNQRRNNVDMRRWQRSFDSPRRFRHGAYNAPRGYSYRRWAYGQRLPREYYARNYYLMDFVIFGLLSPPDDDFVWVRYGPDALLVDRETGEIIQVQYNVFYS